MSRSAKKDKKPPALTAPDEEFTAFDPDETDEQRRARARRWAEHQRLLEQKSKARPSK